MTDILVILGIIIVGVIIILAYDNRELRKRNKRKENQMCVYLDRIENQKLIIEKLEKKRENDLDAMAMADDIIINDYRSKYKEAEKSRDSYKANLVKLSNQLAAKNEEFEKLNKRFADLNIKYSLLKSQKQPEILYSFTEESTITMQ